MYCTLVSTDFFLHRRIFKPYKGVGSVATSVMIAIDTVTVQKLPAQLCCFLGKDNLRHSFAWRSWQAVLNFGHLSIKLKNPMFCDSDAFLQVRRIHIKIKNKT